MGMRFANNFNKPLATGCLAGDTTISLSAANAAALQTAIGGELGGDYLYATLVNSSNNIEIVKITAINTGMGALTVERGQDLTTARAWLAGDILSVRPCRAVFIDALAVTLGSDPEIAALAALTSAADKGIHFTGPGTAATHDLTPFARTLLDDANQATALETLGAALNGVITKTANYTVVSADRGKLIDCTTGTWTLSLTAAATLGAGFGFAVRNSGAGVITIDPNSTEQIDGATTITLAAGESCLVVCNGTAWKTVGRTVIPTITMPDVYWELIGEASISAVSYIDMTLDAATYAEFRLVLDGVVPATHGAFLEGLPLHSGGTAGGEYCAVYSAFGYGSETPTGIGLKAWSFNTPLLVGGILNTNSTYSYHGVGTAAGQHGHAVVDIAGFGASLASGLSVVSKCGFVGIDGLPKAAINSSAYCWDGTTERQLTGLRLQWSIGNFVAAGSYKLFGFRRAAA